MVFTDPALEGRQGALAQAGLGVLCLAGGVVLAGEGAVFDALSAAGGGACGFAALMPLGGELLGHCGLCWGAAGLIGLGFGVLEAAARRIAP